MLQRLGHHLMMEAAINPWLRTWDKPEQTAVEELHEAVDDRLKQLWPVDYILLDFTGL